MEFAWALLVYHLCERAKTASETYLAKVMPTIHTENVQVNCSLGVDKLSYYDFLLAFFFYSAVVHLLGKLIYWM